MRSNPHGLKTPGSRRSVGQKAEYPIFFIIIALVTPHCALGLIISTGLDLNIEFLFEILHQSRINVASVELLQFVAQLQAGFFQCRKEIALANDEIIYLLGSGK